MATRKRAPRTVKAVLKPCPVCKSEGEVSVPVRVGRKGREVGRQLGWCLACEGTGLDPNQ